MTREMNQAERAEELDRQLKLIAHGESSIIACPWCGTISDSRTTSPADGDCCPEFTAARDERGVKQLQSIERQRAEMMSGARRNQRGMRKSKGGIVKRDSIQCPYCDEINRPETAMGDPSGWKREGVSPYCCDLFQIAVVAIAQRAHVVSQTEKVHRIEEAIAKAERN